MKGESKRRGFTLTALYFLLMGLAVALLFRLTVSNEPEMQKIGFIMTGSVFDESNFSNYDGVRTACKSLGTELLLRDRVPEFTGACPEAVKELADEGADMIILSSPGYSQEMESLFDSYPQIAFYGMFADRDYRNLTGYSARMYQARYLSGIIAGMYSKNGKIGFVSTTSSSESCRNINAFALGVRRVAPEAEVIVAWTGNIGREDEERRAANALISDEKVDVITHHQEQYAVVDAAEEAGVASIGYYNEDKSVSDLYLTCAACNWEVFYTELIREYLRGEGRSLSVDWVGLDAGAVGLTKYSPLVPQAAVDEVERAKEQILAGMDVFTNEIYDNEGQLRCGPGEAMTDETLRSRIDWLAEGVRVYE